MATKCTQLKQCISFFRDLTNMELLEFMFEFNSKLPLVEGCGVFAGRITKEIQDVMFTAMVTVANKRFNKLLLNQIQLN